MPMLLTSHVDIFSIQYPKKEYVSETRISELRLRERVRIHQRHICKFHIWHICITGLIVWKFSPVSFHFFQNSKIKMISSRLYNPITQEKVERSHRELWNKIDYNMVKLKNIGILWSIMKENLRFLQKIHMRLIKQSIMRLEKCEILLKA